MIRDGDSVSNNDMIMSLVMETENVMSQRAVINIYSFIRIIISRIKYPSDDNNEIILQMQ